MRPQRRDVVDGDIAMCQLAAAEDDLGVTRSGRYGPMALKVTSPIDPTVAIVTSA